MQLNACIGNSVEFKSKECPGQNAWLFIFFQYISYPELKNKKKTWVHPFYSWGIMGVDINIFKKCCFRQSQPWSFPI